MTRGMKLLLIAPLALAAMALFIFLGGWVVMSLWNWLLPPLFGWHTLTFWQALALLVLCRILFGNWSAGRGSGGGRWRERMRARMEEKCRNLSPEEREAFRQKIRQRWGFDPGAPAEPRQP